MEKPSLILRATTEIWEVVLLAVSSRRETYEFMLSRLPDSKMEDDVARLLAFEARLSLALRQARFSQQHAEQSNN